MNLSRHVVAWAMMIFGTVITIVALFMVTPPAGLIGLGLAVVIAALLIEFDDGPPKPGDRR